MKAKKIENQITCLEQSMKDKIKKIGVIKSSEQLGLKYPDISAWINNKRLWSYGKILEIAQKLGL